MAAKSWAPSIERRDPETLTRSFGILIVCSAGLLSLFRSRNNDNLTASAELMALVGDRITTYRRPRP